MPTAKTMADALGNLAGLKAAIDDGPFDAVIASSPENIRYVGDVGVWSQTVIRERPVFIIWPQSSDPVYVVGTIEYPRIKKESWIRTFRTCEQTSADALDVLVQALRDLKLARGRVAMELDYLPARWVTKLSHALPEMRMEEAEPVFTRARMHKSQAEREHLSRAYKCTGDAFFRTFREIRVGETEKQASVRLATHLLGGGADAAAFIFLTGRENSLLSHPHPTNYAFQPGELVKSDSGGMFQDYFTNLGRTAKLGPLDDEDRSYWSRLRDIQDEIASMLRPGNTGGQLFQHARELYAAAGLPAPNSHNGHGIGLRIHERPMISAGENIPYEAGMVSTVETRVRVPGKGAYHMEDLYEVTASAPILHSSEYTSQQLMVIS